MGPEPRSGAQGGALCHHEFMIALLRGVLLEKHPNQAIVDVGGVGRSEEHTSELSH